MRRWINSSTETYETYGSWANMNYRCHNPDHPWYPDYGARGIFVCDRWRDDYDAFYQDMGPRPEGMTLERIDLNGNYEPNNCRWATRLEQSRNTRRNRTVTFQGETLCVAEWAERLGLHKSALEQRLNKYSVEKAMTSEWYKRAKPEHGTVYMYTRKKCRCDLCKNNWKQYQRDWKARKKLEYDL